jgi:hypothetical protein
MKSISKSISTTLFCITLAVCMAPVASAHMMVAQHGTLNVVGDGAFMILSLPVSAFEGIDDDGDSKLSMEEFDRHRQAIVEKVTQYVTLSDASGSLSLQGIMLAPVESHDAMSGPASQLIVLGRFALQDPSSPMLFKVGLFGGNATEQLLEITATRKFDSQEQVFELTPTMSVNALFPDGS